MVQKYKNAIFFLSVCLLGLLIIQAGDTQEWQKKPGLYAIIETSTGTIVCELFEKQTPITVANFVGLAEGTKEWLDPKTGQKVKRRFYDGLIFHRVIPEFMIQGGCPLGTGRGGPGYTFKDEILPELRFVKPGLLAMANAGPNTNGSQFFITEVPCPWLDGKHTIFGQVVQGQEVVYNIARVKCDTNHKPITDIFIKKVTIKRIGGEKMKKVALIIASRDFRDEEYLTPKKKFTDAGIQVVTVSTVLTDVKGMLGAKAKPELLLKDLKVDDYDAIIFVGGIGSNEYWDNAIAHNIAKEAVAKGKVLAAICIAPVTLARAGVLVGKKATAFPSVKNDLIACKANFTGKAVEQDGKILTGRGPEAAEEFAKAILNLLK